MVHSRHCVLPDHTEVLTYTYSVEECANLEVFLLLDLALVNQRSGAVDFEIRNGIVQDYRRRTTT